MYKDSRLVSEEIVFVQDGVLKDSTSNSYYDFSDTFSVSYENSKSLAYFFVAQKEKKYENEFEQVDFSLVEQYQNDKMQKGRTTVIGKKSMRMQDGKFIPYKNDDGKLVKESGDKFPVEFENALKKIITAMEEEASGSKSNAVSAADNAGSAESRVESEKITVTSTPNKSYIFYQIAGKPFVILGSSAWNILKCVGYAFVNFLGGYNAATGNVDGIIWMLPSWSKSKEKAAEAREANKVEHYPEYHIPFTDNRIVIEKYDKDISSVSLANEDAEIIAPIERIVYEQPISVQRSAAADAASTAAVAGLIGTAVTIPVSAITWVGGAASGIYIDMMQSKD